MVAALVRAIETPPARGVRSVDVPEIRRAASDITSKAASQA